MDKKLIALFAQQNKMSFTTKQVDSFIKDNFGELYGVAHEITGSNLASLPPEILNKICSYLKLSKVNYSHTIEEEKNANDITSSMSTLDIALVGDKMEDAIE